MIYIRTYIHMFSLDSQGTVKQLQDLTGWRGHNVLYFGDHPYSDLADVTLEHGWRTGAIISELTVFSLQSPVNLLLTTNQYITLARDQYLKYGEVQANRQLAADANPVDRGEPRLPVGGGQSLYTQMDAGTR